MNEEDRLTALRRELARGPVASDLDHVLPLIVPRGYFARGNWPGPYRLLRHPKLGLTWVVLRPDETMLYVNEERARLWHDEGVDFPRRAMENLAREQGGRVWTHEKRSDDGRLLFAAMMHDDGIGSSRLLLAAALRELVGEEYLLGIPDRSCALVFPRSRLEAANASQMTKDIFDGASTPMLGELVAPASLVVE